MHKNNKYLSQALKTQLVKIKRLKINTSKTVPGHIVIKVFKTNCVLKLIRFNAPMLLLEASVNSLLCNNIDLQIRYKRKNIGNDKIRSNGVSTLCSP